MAVEAPGIIDAALATCALQPEFLSVHGLKDKSKLIGAGLGASNPVRQVISVRTITVNMIKSPNAKIRQKVAQHKRFYTGKNPC